MCVQSGIRYSFLPSTRPELAMGVQMKIPVGIPKEILLEVPVKVLVGVPEGAPVGVPVKVPVGVPVEDGERHMALAFCLHVPSPGMHMVSVQAFGFVCMLVS